MSQTKLFDPLSATTWPALLMPAPFNSPFFVVSDEEESAPSERPSEMSPPPPVVIVDVTCARPVR